MKKGKRRGRSRCRIFLCYVINFVKNEIVLLSSKFKIQNLVYFFLSAVVMSVCLSMCMCWFHHEKYSILFVCTLINEREKEEQPFLPWKQKKNRKKNKVEKPFCIKLQRFYFGCSLYTLHCMNFSFLSIYFNAQTQSHLTSHKWFFFFSQLSLCMHLYICMCKRQKPVHTYTYNLQTMGSDHWFSYSLNLVDSMNLTIYKKRQSN